MQRRILIAGAAATAVAAASDPASGQQIVWEDVAGADGCYRLKMPKGYRYVHITTNGATVHSYVFMQPDKLVLELVDALVAHPRPAPTGAEVTPALELAQAGMMKSWPGSKVLEQRQITTGPLPGREFTLATSDGSRFVSARLYLTATGIITQVAQGPTTDRSSPLVPQFLDSLQFG